MKKTLIILTLTLAVFAFSNAAEAKAPPIKCTFQASNGNGGTEPKTILVATEEICEGYQAMNAKGTK